MTIRRGQAWAANGPLAPGAPIVSSDAALRALVEGARRRQEPLGEVGVVGGDLWATLGGPGATGATAGTARLRSEVAVRAPIDVIRVELDGQPHWFVAHLIAHRWGWQGEAAVAMNAEWFGPYKLGPRAHPNDGLVDVTSGSLRWPERLEARRRAVAGTHLPHPRLRVQRASHAVVCFARATPIHLDGVAVGRAKQVELHVEADALQVVM